jgi:uncharacterized membrane protein YgdD (TMEM256/DUF423 family)
MQPKQIQQKQMTQHQMQVKQMSNPQFTRQHNQHQHSMTIANPQRDTRQMAIPSGTFQDDGFAQFKGLPFRWLRTWLFSLLALIALPLGGMLIVVGMAMQADSDTWEQATAVVDRYDEGESLRFHIDNEANAEANADAEAEADADNENEAQNENAPEVRGRFNYDYTDFYAAKDDQFSLTLSVCDLVSRFLPTEQGATFNVWLNPADSTQISCIPVSSDTGALLLLLGWALVILSALRLLRTIGAAATRPATSTR